VHAHRIKLEKERKITMFLLIVGFAAGIFVAYKYPQQVDQAIQSGKNAFNDLKDKIFKKSS
jgi:hypothetical protein